MNNVKYPDADTIDSILASYFNPIFVKILDIVGLKNHLSTIPLIALFCLRAYRSTLRDRSLCLYFKKYTHNYKAHSQVRLLY